jgi:hypothetical protein
MVKFIFDTIRMKPGKTRRAIQKKKQYGGSCISCYAVVGLLGLVYYFKTAETS